MQPLAVMHAGLVARHPDAAAVVDGGDDIGLRLAEHAVVAITAVRHVRRRSAPIRLALLKSNKSLLLLNAIVIFLRGPGMAARIS